MTPRHVRQSAERNDERRNVAVGDERALQRARGHADRDGRQEGYEDALSLRHRGDPAGETEHRADGKIDLPRHDHEQHPDGEHAGHRHLFQQVRQIDRMQEQPVRIEIG